MPSLPSGSGPSGCFDAITSSILKIIVATSVALLTACVLTLKGSTTWGSEAYPQMVRFDWMQDLLGRNS